MITCRVHVVLIMIGFLYPLRRFVVVVVVVAVVVVVVVVVVTVIYFAKMFHNSPKGLSSRKYRFKI